LWEDFENFVLKGFTTSQIHVLCANFVKFGRPEIGKSRALFTGQKNKKDRLALSLPKSTRASGKQCTYSAPKFIQIGSLPAELEPSA